MNIVRLLKEKHHKIAAYFKPVSKSGEKKKTSVGADLMSLDSQLMEKILLRLTDMGIPALPVHDELVARLTDSTKAWEVMKSEFKEMFGQTIDISGTFSETLDDAIFREHHKPLCPEWEDLVDQRMKSAIRLDDEEYHKYCT